YRPTHRHCDQNTDKSVKQVQNWTLSTLDQIWSRDISRLTGRTRPCLVGLHLPGTLRQQVSTVQSTPPLAAPSLPQCSTKSFRHGPRKREKSHSGAHPVLRTPPDVESLACRPIP